jgi:hypothetical protein
VEWQSQGRSNQHRSHSCGDASFSGRTRPAKVHRALEKALDRLARAGWLATGWSTTPSGAVPVAGRDCDHRRHGQFFGKPPDKQVIADVLVATRGRSPATGSPRRLQWDARLRLRTEIPARQRYAPAGGDCRLTPNLRRSRAGGSSRRVRAKRPPSIPSTAGMRFSCSPRSGRPRRSPGYVPFGLPVPELEGCRDRSGGFCHPLRDADR